MLIRDSTPEKELRLACKILSVRGIFLDYNFLYMLIKYRIFCKVIFSALEIYPDFIAVILNPELSTHSNVNSAFFSRMFLIFGQIIQCNKNFTELLILASSQKQCFHKWR